jgi:hypothetical protein
MNGEVAQLEEQGTHKPLVVGSNPTLATTSLQHFLLDISQYKVVLGGLSWIDFWIGPWFVLA